MEVRVGNVATRQRTSVWASWRMALDVPIVELLGLSGGIEGQLCETGMGNIRDKGPRRQMRSVA